MKYQIQLEEKASITFTMSSVLIFVTIYPMVIGMFLRLPKLIMEIKEKRQWTFDWIKFVSIGIPALFITTLPILSYIFEKNCYSLTS